MAVKKDASQKMFMIENTSKMNRVAVRGLEKSPENKLARIELSNVFIHVGYNIFTEDEYNVIKTCEYTKGMFGLGGWFVEHQISDNITDIQIRDLLQKCQQAQLLLFLKEKTTSLDLRDKIQSMLPRRISEEQQYTMDKELSL